MWIRKLHPPNVYLTVVKNFCGMNQVVISIIPRTPVVPCKTIANSCCNYYLKQPLHAAPNKFIDLPGIDVVDGGPAVAGGTVVVGGGAVGKETFVHNKCTAQLMVAILKRIKP